MDMIFAILLIRLLKVRFSPDHRVRVISPSLLVF